ncbi:E1B 55k [Murine adenovirus 3]|uniref:E1B 55 kDa protein n=1 Tax=Murine adenovirus 3 TaxID=573199 RepID=C3SAT4_9ADEN|nr:E1B 55k [Murine adenovirus 3]ACJ14505.1 E1B 55k [Murine adenovirus 3]
MESDQFAPETYETSDVGLQVANLGGGGRRDQAPRLGAGARELGLRVYEDPQGPAFNTVTFQEILNAYQANSLSFFLTDLHFERVRVYEFGEGEGDLGEAIATHAKIALDPGVVYHVRRPVQIQGLCYVIGRGAVIQVHSTVGQRAFQVFRVLDRSPRIMGMLNVTFVECKFHWVQEGDSEVSLCRQFTLFYLAYDSIFYACDFFGFSGLTLRSMCHIRVEGCTFVGCAVALHHADVSDLKVKGCHFSQCIVCIFADGPALLTGNCATNCDCFAILEQEGLVAYNSVVYKLPGEDAEDLIICHHGYLYPLSSIHIVRSLSCEYPKFKNNVFAHVDMHVGLRQGLMHFKQCNLSYVYCMVEGESVPRTSFYSSYLQSVTIAQIVHFSREFWRVCLCFCGQRHKLHFPSVVHITPTAVPDRTRFTVDVEELSDDD